MSIRHLVTLTTILVSALLLAGCGDKIATAAHHDKNTGAKITHFGDKTELYVEFPVLVVGKDATFVAHFTQLTDFKPLTAGKLSIVLSGSNQPEERFTANISAVPGIFKPVVTPKMAGERKLSLIVESALGTLTHELGTVTVFADANSAEANHGDHGDVDSAIAFSKEQQWKIDFATVEAVKGIARPSVAAIAIIKAHPDSEARLSASVSGVLRSAGSFPRVGQVVKKGQVLALLAPRLGGDTDQATLDAAAGKARIALDQARRERERMEALFKDEAVAEKRLLEARANEGMAQAEADAAQSRAGQSGGSGGISIRAPIEGIVVDVSVATGAFVSEGTPLFHVANTQRLWMEARVPESDIGRLGSPTGAAFSVDGFAQSFVIEPGKNGKLIGIGGAVDAGTRTVPVIYEFVNPGSGSGGVLRLGMTAKAQLFSGGDKEAVLVPASAVQDESGTQVIYVQTGGESFERRIVQTGARDGDRIAIVAGLESGQRVVSKGAYLIRLSTSKTGPSGHAH